MINLPADFVSRTKKLLGKDWDLFQQALSEEPPVSIRLNTSKTGAVDNPPFASVPWNKDGFYLGERPQFTFDPLFHSGCYYVQEASSMFIGHVLDQYVEGDVRVLDLCAAPGGKSTLIASWISDNSLLVSNEVVRSRANILAENMTKWGRSNFVVTNNDPFEIGKLREFFDVILVDAPCSGEGMFRKDKGAIDEWSVANVNHCKERQQEILADIWPALKPDGILIYSTCTYNTEENEENVQWLCDELYAQTLPVEIKEEWGISPSFVEGLPAYRFFPHKVKGEGFFCAVVRKQSSDAPPYSKYKTGKDKPSTAVLPPAIKEYILNRDGFTFYQHKDMWHAVKSGLCNDLQILRSSLNIVAEGICLGGFKGKDFIPSQSLAMSIDLNREAFTVCEIDWATAINYFRREPLLLPDQPKGFILLTYRHIPLGFVKNIGNRANNLYPQEWRIRSSNIPDEPINVGLF